MGKVFPLRNAFSNENNMSISSSLRQLNVIVVVVVVLNYLLLVPFFVRSE